MREREISLKNELWDKEIHRMKNNHFRELIGVKLEEIDDGKAILILPVSKKLLQPNQVVHGGVISVLIDSVIGTAVRTILTDHHNAMTAEMNINYFRPVSKGVIKAEGKIIHKGGTLVVGVADIFDEEGKLLATGRATYVLKSKKQ
ncbi:hypothetical protein CKF48_21840 [Cytobacillus kochii]|uniref:Thioesterase domain-containing protein n=1 Tax=Cytobacillus kochii TaxID=859143 RepID=A0A248TNK2_9BACI|nr:hypothetical protein CKF48_21840 [Cytobacillus kochii]